MRAVAVTALVLLAAMLVGSGTSVAAGDTRVLDRHGLNVDAMRGVVLWHHEQAGHVALMRRLGGRTSRVPGVRRAPSAVDLNLGVRAGGRVVATYAHCRADHSRCGPPAIVDVRWGGEHRLTLPARPGCRARAASVWNSRVAYALSCPRAPGSGVYVARSGHARRLLSLGSREAARVSVDLGSTMVAAAFGELRIASTTGPSCQQVVPRPTIAGAEFRGVQVTGNHVWWTRAVLRDFGGGETLLAGATVGNACAVTVDAAVRDLSRYLPDPWAEHFAIDGSTLYLAGPELGDVFSVSLPDPEPLEHGAPSRLMARR